MVVSTSAIAGEHERCEQQRDVRNPTSVSRRPPRKKPTPFSAFFDPVRIATQRKRASFAPSGTTSLTALFELIFVRSFAIPESACEAITYGATSHGEGAKAEHQERAELHRETIQQRDLEAETCGQASRRRGS